MASCRMQTFRSVCTACFTLACLPRALQSAGCSSWSCRLPAGMPARHPQRLRAQWPWQPSAASSPCSGALGGRGAKVASRPGAQGPVILPRRSPGSPGRVLPSLGGAGGVPACLLAAGEAAGKAARLEQQTPCPPF